MATVQRGEGCIVNSGLSSGQLEILLRMGRNEDVVPEELLKLSALSLADGVIDQEEASSLFAWLKKDAKKHDNIITKILLSRVKDMLSDGKFDEEERVELLHLLSSLHGVTAESSCESFSSNLPLCVPSPAVIFMDKSFCLTGQFAYGPRFLCQQAIEERGGKIEKRLSWRVNYLVIGTLCTEAWAHPTYGRKIEEATLLKARGSDLHIISEDHWARSAFKM